MAKKNRSQQPSGAAPAPVQEPPATPDADEQTVVNGPATQGPAPADAQQPEGALVEAPPTGTEGADAGEQPPADEPTGEQEGEKAAEKITPEKRLADTLLTFIPGEKIVLNGTEIVRPTEGDAKALMAVADSVVDGYLAITAANIKEAMREALIWEDLSPSWLNWQPFLHALASETRDPVRTLKARQSLGTALHRELLPTAFYQSQAEGLQELVPDKVREIKQTRKNAEGKDEEVTLLEIIDTAWYEKRVMPHAAAGGKSDMLADLMKRGANAAEKVGDLNFINPAVGTKVITKANQSRVQAGNAPVQTPNTGTATAQSEKVLYKDGVAYPLRQGTEKNGVWAAFVEAHLEQLPDGVKNAKGVIQNFYPSTGVKGAFAIDHFLEQGDNKAKYPGLTGLGLVKAWALANGWTESQ